MEEKKRKIGFTDLPSETLFQIFNHAKFNGHFDPHDLRYFERCNQNGDDIMNIRLTCRRFAKVAAHLLPQVAHCSLFDAQSLESFERLSRDSFFSKHVQIVHVHLGFYEPLLADSQEALAAYLCTMWGEYIQRMPKDGDFVTETIPQVMKTVQHWSLVADGQKKSAPINKNTPIPEANKNDAQFITSMRILRGIHDEYRRRYLAQQYLRKSGDGIRRLAQAMARMPHATRLVLDDDRSPGPEHLGAAMVTILGAGLQAAFDSGCALFATTVSWAASWQFKKDDDIPMKSPLRYFRPPCDLIIDLPVAVHAAGVKLTGLRISGMQIPNAVPAWDCYDPYGWVRHPPYDFSDQINLAGPEALREACKGLKVLEITPMYGDDCFARVRSAVTSPFRDINDYDLTRLGYVVKYMMPETLTQVHLDCASIGFRDEDGFREEYSDRIFKASRWPNLQVLHLQNARIKNTETSLLKMIRQLPDLYDVRLDHVGLIAFYRPLRMAGQASWSYLIEHLRNEVPRLCENRRTRGLEQDLPIIIRRAAVSERTAFEVYCCQEIYQAHVNELFNVCDIAGRTKVDNYLLRATEVNPLVTLNNRLGGFLCERLLFSDMAYDLSLHDLYNNKTLT
ncbi:hypothetical protein M0657_008512 [Pyricularia oryzae]|uniref:F-box domain-containing protein n=2 Tax=Pyricularia oryzae TaxID=318829 RepID=A0AA97PGB5_PYRO3|nr:hypothetical protein OOU_Y34scaffold00926g16 [Pyricularia oryzae Y34]KAI7916607.1 hypothetical protein M0657_008512 [Pyricularia oryzae]